MVKVTRSMTLVYKCQLWSLYGSLTIQKLWPKLKEFFDKDTQTQRQTGQKLDAPVFDSRGIKIHKTNYIQISYTVKVEIFVWE